MSIKTIAGYNVTQFKRLNPPQFEGANREIEIVYEGVVKHGVRPLVVQTVRWTKEGDTINKESKNYHLNLETVPAKFILPDGLTEHDEMLDILKDVYTLGLHRNHPNSDTYKIGTKVKEKLEKHGRI